MLGEEYIAAGVVSATDQKPSDFQSTMKTVPVGGACNCIQAPCDCEIQTITPTTQTPTTEVPTTAGDTLDVSAYVDKGIEWAKANKTTVAVAGGALLLFLVFKGK